MTSMQAIIDKVNDLDPLPPTASRLAAAMASERSTVDDLVKIITYDQAMTIDILKFANSTASGPSRTITSLREAVIRLGGARILEQIVGRRLSNQARAAMPGYGYAESDLWRHSVASAVAAECLGQFATNRVDGLSFTAALLHDVGKLVISRGAPAGEIERVERMVAAQDASCTWEQAERHVLGFSHAEIGAEIARKWLLPDAIVNAVGGHHRSDLQGDPVTDSVRVANIVARMIGEGLGNEGMSVHIDSAVSARMGLTRENCERLCALTSTKLSEVLRMFDE